MLLVASGTILYSAAPVVAAQVKVVPSTAPTKLAVTVPAVQFPSTASAKGQQAVAVHQHTIALPIQAQAPLPVLSPAPAPIVGIGHGNAVPTGPAPLPTIEPSPIGSVNPGQGTIVGHSTQAPSSENNLGAYTAPPVPVGPGSTGPGGSAPVQPGGTIAPQPTSTVPNPPIFPGKEPEKASGIIGKVVMGPSCPVVQSDSACPDQPYSTNLVIRDKAGNEVAFVTSDANGDFMVILDPGTYTVSPANNNPVMMSHADSVTVTIEKGQMKLITVEYDSGLR